MNFLLLLVALLGAVFAAATDFPVEDGVLVLGEDNFKEALAAHQNILVEFYAPWCGHCKSLAPEYAKAAKALANAPVKLAKVDATEHNSLAQAFGVKGFPTLKFFKNGNPTDYNGGRTESEIVGWLNKKTGPSCATVTTEAQLEALKENNEAFAFGVFASLESAAAKNFVAAADLDENHVYAYTTDAALRAKLGVEGDAVVVLKSFDDLRADLAVAETTTSEEIATFVLGNTAPLIQEFSKESSKKIFSSKVTNHVLFFTDKTADHHADVLANYRAVAADFKGAALFVNIPATENSVLGFFDLTPDQLPAMVLADLASPSGIKKFKYPGAHVSADIKKFVESFFAGELKPFLKTEEAQPEDTTGDVVVLRGTTFADLVINNDKDVLVKFYAPWCGHCKKLAPVWEELGKEMQSHENVVIAKFDATANEIDVAGVAVQGFPTILFFKGNDKAHPQKYEEGRNLDDFIKFLETNAHNSFVHEEL